MKKYLVLFLIIIANPVCAMQNEQNQMIQFPPKEVIRKELDILPFYLQPFIEHARLVDLFANKQMSYSTVTPIVESAVSHYNQQIHRSLIATVHRDLIRKKIIEIASLVHSVHDQQDPFVEFPSQEVMQKKLDGLLPNCDLFIKRIKLVNMFADCQVRSSAITPMIESAANHYNQQRCQLWVLDTKKDLIKNGILRTAFKPWIDASSAVHSPMLKFPSEDVIRKNLYSLPLFLQPFIELSKLVDIFADKQITSSGVKTIIELARKKYNDQYPVYRLSTVDVKDVYKAVLSGADLCPSKAKL